MLFRVSVGCFQCFDKLLFVGRIAVALKVLPLGLKDTEALGSGLIPLDTGDKLAESVTFYCSLLKSSAGIGVP